MKLVRSPNPWSCLVSAFASFLDIEPDVIFQELGHDGSQIIYPDLPEPMRRKAFHIQELIDVAIKHGYLVTPIEALPFSVVNVTAHHTHEFPQGNAYRLSLYMEKGEGILTGKNLRGNRHAVIWHGGQIHDTSRMESYEPHLFQIDTFWMLSRARARTCSA